MSIDYTVPFAAGIALVLLAFALGIALGIRRAVAALLHRSWRPVRPARRAGAVLLALGGLLIWATPRCKGATVQHAAVDLVMTQAPRPPRSFHTTVIPPAPYLLLAGDVHCHINPPDWSDHVARHLPETIALARAEGLDFVSLVPHVFSDFYANANERSRVVSMLETLHHEVDTRPDDGLILDVGLEYIDPTGHVGMVFGDVLAALAATPLEVAVARPGAFFEAFADRGGVLVINHPLLTPTFRYIPVASFDISWRPWTSTAPFRPEIAAVDARATSVEAANLFVSAFRDRLFHSDSEESTRNVLSRLDHEILARGRRMTPVGGTDSHSFHLRPMTFVLADARTRAAIGAAIHAGRTCVVQPGACTFEVRADGAFLPIGGSIEGATHVEARASGREIALYRNGELVASPAGGEIVRIEIAPGTCSVLRATVDGGYSAPIYVNCPFASRPSRTDL